MKQGNIDKWTNIDACENLLFFAQLVNELLFDYSIPSNRISTLNSHYLVIDALSAITSIEENGVPEGTLKPIMEELYYEISKDVIFDDGKPLEYFVKRQNSNTVSLAKPRDLNFLESKNCVKAIKDVFFTNDIYYKKIKEEIIGIIISNKKDEQQKLFKLTKVLLTELNNKGYSLKYLYMIMDRLFWNPKKDIESNSLIKEFFNAFDFKPKTYTIIFKVKWKKMYFLLEHMKLIGVVNELSDSEADTIDSSFKKMEKDEKFLVVKKEALDPYSAALNEINEIELATSVYRLYNHSYRYDIQTADYRVLNGKQCYKKGKTIKAVEHIKMPKEAQILESVDLVAKAITGITKIGSYSDFFAVLNAVRYHAHSLDSRAEENQLLDLWSIFEAVLDISNKHTADRIQQICLYLVPILKHKYVYSLFYQLLEDVRGYDEVWFDENIQGEKDEQVRAIAEFTLLEKNKKERQEFYDRCNDFPLLKERIQYYNKMLNNTKSLHAYVEKHANRVQWQIMRIYRNRNLIIHSAEKMPYLTLLIENLHSYVDVFLNYVIHSLAQERDITSMCQELFVKECKWNAKFARRKEPISSNDIEEMLSL